MSVRRRIVEAARWGIAHEPQVHYCVPDDHRMLTRRGLRFREELLPGELVAVLDPQSHEIRYEPLLAVTKSYYEGDLLELENYGATLRCTPDHRWPTERALEWGGWKGHERLYGGTRAMKSATAMSRRDHVPLTGTFGATNSALSPRHAAILGWIVTDGTTAYRFRKDGSSRLVARIGQSERKYLSEIVDLTGRPATAMREDGVAIVTPAREDVEVIERVYQRKDDLPALVGELSSDAAHAMWDAMMKAEGTAGRRFKQRPGPVMDAFRILSFLTGHAGVCRRSNGMETLYVRDRRYLTWRVVRRRRWRGTVWCPTTPSGTWVVEHEGLLVPTGNSEMRPIPLARTLPLTTDCSGFVTLCYHLAGAPDPNGRGYDGQGWTGGRC
ncbi:MAG: Hint domain-containing protein [Gaiellaceae bacterium]